VAGAAKLKILQVVQKPQRRGAEVFAFQLSQELRHQGHRVHTAYLYPASGSATVPLQNGDRLLAGRENHPFEKLPGFHPNLLFSLKQTIETFQPDVVQVNGARTVKYGAFARRLMRDQPWVLIYRNIGQPQDWVRGWHYALFYRTLVMPNIDGVVGVSRVTLDNVKKFYNLSIPTARISNGVTIVDCTRLKSRAVVRRELQTPADAPVILYVGSLSPEKRLDRLLRVVGQVRQQVPALQALQVWLVGDGPLRAALEQQVKAEGLAQTVRFLGVQSDVAAYMNSADLFLLTSDTEGIPAVILEAGLLGLPVVATRVGGLPECVLDGETGQLVDPGDEARLAQVVTDLLRCPARRHRMGARAKAWVRANFTMDIIARQYLDFYREVLDLRRAEYRNQCNL